MVSSPGYPNNYEANSNCTWLIVVATGRTVRVQFNSNFNIQGNQGSCGGDYLEVCVVFYLEYFYTLTLVMLNKDATPTSNFQPIRLLDPGFLIEIHIFNDKQCRSKSVGFLRSQLIWICSVC